MDEVSTNQYAIVELSLEREFITDIAVCLELIYSTSGLRLVQILCKSGGRKEESRETFRGSFIEMITDKLDYY